MANSAWAWAKAREQDIADAYEDKERWTKLDRDISEHFYSFESIEEWPLDAAVIHRATDQASVLLGSIKAACCLEDISKTLSVKVTGVVTVCAGEMAIRGAPMDWRRYFERESVFHIQCHMADTTLKPMDRWIERIPELVTSTLEQWQAICARLWVRYKMAVKEEESIHVLFHCWGGINRNAGVLCAWLVLAHNFSAEEAVRLLLEKRPSLHPWHNRPYVLQALWNLERSRAEWQRQVGAVS